MRKNILISLGLLVVAAIGFFLILPRPGDETPPVVDPIDVASPEPISAPSAPPPATASIEETASQVATTTQSFWTAFIASTDPDGDQSATNQLYSLLSPDLQSRIPKDTMQTPISVAQELDLTYLPNSFEVQTVTQQSETMFTADTSLVIPNRESVMRTLTLTLVNGEWKVDSLK